MLQEFLPPMSYSQCTNSCKLDGLGGGLLLTYRLTDALFSSSMHLPVHLAILLSSDDLFLYNYDTQLLFIPHTPHASSFLCYQDAF